MATFTGTGADDAFVGTTTADTFDLSQGGNDTASGLDGDDAFGLGAEFNAADRIDGGTGNDTVTLAGDYSTQLVLDPATLQNVETIALDGGFNYNLKLDDGNVGGSTRLTVDASALGAGNALTFDGRAETDGFFSLVGGAGNDVLLGGNTSGGSCDFFYLQNGGDDTAKGGAGSDDFFMGGALNAADKINGGAGADGMVLDGDYSAGVIFNATTMRNIEFLWLNGGHSYKLTTADETVAAGATLDVNFPILTGPGITGPLGPGDSLYFDGSAETNGYFNIAGSPGDDTLIGGAKADTFYSGAYEGPFDSVGGGNDTMRGGGGDDTFFFQGDFNASDFVNGGSGSDTLVLNGDYSGGLVLSSGDFKSIEELQLDPSGSYDITTTDSAVAAGKGLIVNGVLLDQPLRFDGSAETNGSFDVSGGDANDRIVTGAGDDFLDGHAGADFLRGGGGVDRYFFDRPTDSTSTSFDTVFGFNANVDHIVVNTDNPTVDTEVTHGRLSTATFDQDLAAAIDPAHLGKNHAVLFVPHSGDFAGDTFLIVDHNGHAGYQAGVDYVIRLENASHLAQLQGSFELVT